MCEKRLFKIQVVIVLVIVLLIGLCSCGTEENGTVQDNSEAEINEQLDDAIAENEYVQDDVVNQFIVDYNAVSKHAIEDISNGNIRTKFHAYSNDCYLELLNGTDRFHCTIYLDDVELSAAIIVLKSTLSVLRVSENDINAICDSILNNSYIDNKNDSVEVIYYAPSDYSAGRIEVATTVYSDKQ